MGLADHGIGILDLRAISDRFPVFTVGREKGIGINTVFGLTGMDGVSQVEGMVDGKERNILVIIERGFEADEGVVSSSSSLR